ncbi:ESX secretion-associated protein EspG [Nocardia sp. R16R-3T]
MNRTWTFTDLEFVVLWERIHDDFLPLPLSFATNLRTWAELDRAKAEAGDRLLRTRERTFDGVLEAIARADIRIAVSGSDGADPANPAGSIRIYATRKADRGYVVRQSPGETIWHSAGFTITEVDALDLAEAVVRQLPHVDAGKMSGIVLDSDAPADNDGMDYSFGRSIVLDSFEDSVGRRAEHFLALPTSTVGMLEISQGSSRYGPRGMVRRRLKWRDVVADGRYVINAGSPPVASGADAKRFVAMVNTEIATVIRVIKDERV